MHNLDGRHPAVKDVAMWFHFDHLPDGLRDISRKVHDFAEDMIDHIPDDPQLTLGLQHLLMAKDAFVRAFAKHNNQAHPLATDTNHS